MKRWPLLVGEIFVDVTITPSGVENKLRLGGIAHAARGFWALNQPFAVAAVLPSYLESSAQTYLAAFGCKKFTKLGTVVGAPNTMLIFDPTEVDDQEYDDLLREEKQVQITQGLKENDFSEFEDALIFPGTYDLSTICKLLPVNRFFSTRAIQAICVFISPKIRKTGLLDRPALNAVLCP